jgi:hypothetical protein
MSTKKNKRAKNIINDIIQEINTEYDFIDQDK